MTLCRSALRDPIPPAATRPAVEFPPDPITKELAEISSSWHRRVPVRIDVENSQQQQPLTILFSQTSGDAFERRLMMLYGSDYKLSDGAAVSRTGNSRRTFCATRK